MIQSDTPLFQLNLFLWLVWSNTPYEISGIRPIFREAGFELYSIGPRIQLTQAKRILAGQNEIKINNSARPDILMHNSLQKLLLTLECKLRSFGYQSSTSQQARVLLGCTGEEIASYLGIKNSKDWISQIIYAVTGEDSNRMSESLEEISEELVNIGIETSKFGTVGVVRQDDGIYLEFLSNEGDFINPQEDESPIQVLNTNAQFLYLIPLDLSANDWFEDGYGKRTLKERLRVSIAGLVLRNSSSTNFSISEDEIMREAIEVWDFWQEYDTKKGLLGLLVRPYLRKIVDELGKLHIQVEIDKNILILQM